MSKNILKNLEESRAGIVEALTERASHVCKSAPAFIINEMEDAPDQQRPHLTRDEVARMLAQYEQGNDPAWPTERCPSGVWRTNRFQPDLTTDFSTENNDEGVDGWDYDIEEGVNEDANEDADHENLESPSEDPLTVLVNKAIHNGADLEVTLGDGNTIVLDPHTLQGISNAGLLSDFHRYISDIETFAAAISHPIASSNEVDSDE